MMSINAPLLAEFQHESATTRKCLERLPESDFDWKPHEKSMTLGGLATHIAEMTGWIPSTFETEEVDLASSGYVPPVITTSEDLVKLFDDNLAKAVETLKNASDESMMQTWTLRNGEHTIFSLPRAAVVRTLFINHVIHHRGQLAVYMRLRDIPVPSIYGPSADESPAG